MICQDSNGGYKYDISSLYDKIWWGQLKFKYILAIHIIYNISSLYDKIWWDQLKFKYILAIHII